MGREVAHDLTVGTRSGYRVIDHGDDAASVFPGALRHELLDPVGTASTALGSVLSSTDKDVFAKLDASTAGARLDPPIPHTTVRVRPSRRAASAKRTSSSHCASETCGAVVQARRFIWPRNLTPSRWVACTVRLAASVV